jgi:tRNA(Ile)-lysidine synthase
VAIWDAFYVVGEMTVENDDLEILVTQFVDHHIPSGAPFILGFSGGVDSSALLYLLHKACTYKSRQCHVVHVDHGWRQESAMEAEMLEQRVGAVGIPFSSYRLPACPQGENIEDWSRRQRIACFSAAASAIGTDIVFLAHQADDQLEVVLKRFLEGASLTKFRGMRPVENIHSLTIMRPLLSIRRAALIAYLHEHSLPYLDDPTNKDTSFLRARMREVVFPFLRSAFGKECDNSLLRISHEAADLEQYIHKECARRFAIHVSQGVAFATVLDEEPPSPFLVRCLVDHLKECVQLPSFSRQQVEAAVETFCGIPSGARRFFIGRGGLFAESRFFAAFHEKPCPVETTFLCEQEGRCTIGSWDISWRPSTVLPSETGDWKALFFGAATTWYIPQQPFSVCPTNDQLLRTIQCAAGKSSSVVSLRPFVPAIIQAFRLVADPLSGYTIVLPPGSGCCAVTIQRTG